jgi:hypothetical protein
MTHAEVHSTKANARPRIGGALTIIDVLVTAVWNYASRLWLQHAIDCKHR